MKILDTTPSFFDMATTGISLEKLNHYYSTYPEVFAEYFPNHCPQTEERLGAAIDRYPTNLEDMKLAAALLPGIIEETMNDFIQYFGIELDLNFYILVGGYGSNAFVERKIIGGVQLRNFQPILSI